MDLQNGRSIPGWIAPATAAVVIAAILFEPWISYSIYTTGAVALACAVLIYSLAHGGWLARLISGNTLVLLGEASYAVYILHAPLGGWFGAAVAKLMPSAFAGQTGELARTPSWSFFVCFLAMLVPFCILSLKYFEMPARCLIRSRFKAKPAR
jgi:peptidoglycan/LPS O-acetylase OafA/YrhL